MYRKSFVGILTGIYAIPELDNLIPVAGSGVLYLNPLQLISFLTAQEASHHKYSVAIWGDSHGKRLEGRRWIKDINYDHQSKNLHIVFEDSCTLEVLQPKLIYYTDSYV